MAKISTYTTDTNVTGGDMLIGTDVDNSNATKNFTVSDLAAYMATNLTNFVPYTGATGSVDLGTNDLSLKSLTVNDGISLTGELYTFGSAGSSGDILVSQGAGLSPQWVDGSLTYVPYTGATANVDLGTYKLSATGVDVKTGPLFVNGSAGTINQILVSQGSGTNPAWQSSPYTYVEYASFYSTQTQSPAPSDPPTAWTYNNTDIANANITIANDGIGNPTRITSALGGVYNIQFSAQLSKTGGTDHKASIWLRKNGVDIPNSNTHITLKANANYAVASWNFFVQLNAGQYAEILWYQDGNIQLLYEPADVVVPHPATPSIILTVQRISGTP
jgi:hypothetical protein